MRSTAKAVPHNDLASRMRAAAAAARLDQVVIAERIGTGQSNLNRVMNGKQTPKADLLEAFVREVGCSGHWLLTGEGEMYPVDDVERRVALQEIAAIVGRVVSPRLVPPEVVESAKAEGVVGGDEPAPPRAAEGP